MTGASVNPGNPGGTTYSYSASYDDDLRLLSSSTKLTPNLGGGALYQQALVGYDAASNVTGLDTTLGTGGLLGQTSTDNQSFCYDEQNRLIWATSQTATGPNGCASNTAGTLTGGNALYTETYAYDNLDRLTSGPAGSGYTYGPGMQAGTNPSPLHAALSTSGGYSASYDASGNMLCRAPTSATTCAGTQTGAQLAYDNEGRLTSWQNQPGSNPTSTDAFAYDGEGSRVAQKAVSNGITTTTDYLLGGLEEVTGSTLTEYYPMPGIGTAVRVGSTLNYLASDNLGSVTVALSSSGSVTAQQLYLPYGSVRYSSGQMPTAHGYTGQIADAQTGLSYYGARYYDPTLGQFASADTEIDGGLDRYAYVGGNPETSIDPSGHFPRPTNVPPELESLLDSLYKATQYGSYIGDGSSMDALRQEATTLQPVGGRWHYQKVYDARGAVRDWLKLRTKRIRDLQQRLAHGRASDSEEQELERLQAGSDTFNDMTDLKNDMNDALKQWEDPNNPLYSERGQNPTSSSPASNQSSTGPSGQGGDGDGENLAPQTPATPTHAPVNDDPELEHLMQIDDMAEVPGWEGTPLVRLNENPADSNPPPVISDDLGPPNRAADNPNNTTGTNWSGDGDGVPPVGYGGGGADEHM